MDLNQAIHERWSPRSYRPDPIDEAILERVFEAARWAHSSSNEQPWRFLYAKKNAGPPRLRLEQLLFEGNAYAKQGWVLGLSFGKKTSERFGTPNRHAGHDLGSASQLLSLQAYNLGLGMRFMGGFDVEAARQLAPEDFEPYAMFVIGHPSPGLTAPERSRRGLNEYAFENAWPKGL